ncbi:uncharacterized protein LOC122264468 [Penaeus japonicus]|uniref:uncharacterized protein LOC122264468 n=1 Tax=Penaeus japonicus TaxID=27405 RepID=UPI001C71490E|nr:uncharacterized protein LOC122264468 [Penaeus japonicus]
MSEFTRDSEMRRANSLEYFQGPSDYFFNTKISGTKQMRADILHQEQMHEIKKRDWKTRSEGCEQLRELVRNMDDITALLPHLPHFLVLLDTLIDDSNFRISMTVLDIYRLLIDKLQPSKLPAYLRQIVVSVMKHVGDPKVVVRIENMKVFRKLLQAAQPRLIVPILCDHLGHRASRVREDCLNLLIYALMTHPSYEFDLSYVAEKVGPTVADPKRRVRQASLECLAVIAQFLGPARLGPLMAAVDKAEDQENIDGPMAAVQARLARRKLPKVSPDGLIEYALAIPSSTRRTKLSLPKGADVEWVMAGSGTTTPGTLASSSFLSSSLAASDSQVYALTSSHPQSSPSPRARTAQQDDSLQRKRSFSDVALNRSSSRADDRSLALWTTDPLDLSRTAPNDLGGYRGVYLGKLRQGSSYSRGISVEKGYTLLPNKYATGGLGSARGDRPGSRSPGLVSPSLPRRINALAPLESGEGLVVSRAGSTRSVIPPLSAVSRRSVKQHSREEDIISDPEEDEDDDDDEEEEEDERSEYDYEDDEEIEEEEVEEVLAEEGRSSRPKSSATTRDSGISIFSVSNDGELLTENGSIRDETIQQEVTSRASSRLVQPKGASPASSIPSANGRNSYEPAPTRVRKAADVKSPSSHSLPNDTYRSNGFGVVGKGYNSRSRNSTGGEREFRSFQL